MTLMMCAFRFRGVSLRFFFACTFGLIFNARQETIFVSHIVMFAEKTYNAFEPVGHTKRRKEMES